MAAGDSSRFCVAFPVAFATTHWSAVMAARDPSDPAAQQALETLCRNYWYPLYAYLRRSGYCAHDAQDLTQEFLSQLISHEDLLGVDPQRGRFRSFLLGTLKHFLSDQRKKARALKRGGGRTMIPIDEAVAEQRYEMDLADSNLHPPDEVFERQWGLSVLQRALDRLRARHADRDRAEQFAALEPFLVPSAKTVSYAEAGARLGMSEGGVKTAVHRMRKEFGEILRSEIANTVLDPSEVDEEIRYLIRVTIGS